MAKGLTQSDLGSGLVTPSMISQIESDKANPSYKVLEAIAEKLETPLEFFLADIQTQLEQTSAHKVAKALLAADNYERAVTLLESLLENPSPNLSLLEVSTDLGECYLKLGDLDKAASTYEKVLDIARKKDSVASTLGALLRLGLIEEQRQKYHLAIFHWRTAYDSFVDLPHEEPFLQAQILTHLGRIHYRIGEVNEALRYYQDAHELLSGTTHLEDIGYTYLGLGLSYKKIQEFERATEYSQYAIAVFETLKNIKLAIDVKRNFALLRAENGEASEAFATLEDCLEQYEHHHHPEEAAFTRGEMARLLLKEKKPSKAKAQADLALAQLPASSPASASILRTMALCEDLLGKRDLAIEAMEKAKKVFKQHKLHAELADTCSLLADLYQKRGDLKQANDCLQQMKMALQQNLRERGILL